MPDERSKTRILIAEDDPISLRLVEVMLAKWGYEPVPARDGVEALEILRGENAPKLALLDWMMPRKDGLDVCRELRTQADRPYVYVLLLTAKTQERDLIEGLGAGADDYLTKPIGGDELRARLFAAERILAVQEELTAAREALREQAIRDPLTGLFNRRYLDEALSRELRRAGFGNEPLSILMLDLDGFKGFNDLHGHAAGDALLKEVGRLLETQTRREDVGCRYGGDEFVVIMPGVSLPVALRRADELRHVIGQAEVESRGRRFRPVTLSVGVSCFPEDGLGGPELLAAADQALYRAKRSGRDQVARPKEESQKPV